MSQLTFDEAAVRALEATYMSPDVVAQRARVLDLLAPGVGEQVLDVGVGPGLLAREVARLVGENGRLVGLDSAPAMVAAAAQRLSDFAKSRSGMETPASWISLTEPSTLQSPPRSMSMSPTCRRRSPSFIGCCAPAVAP